MSPLPELSGELSLCLLMAAKCRSLDLLRETLGEIGNSLTEKEGLRIYRQVNLDLNKSDRNWLKGQMLKLYNAAQRMPYTAYLWERRENEPLNAVLTVKLTQAEKDNLDQLAKSEGITRCELARQLLREKLRNAAN